MARPFPWSGLPTFAAEYAWPKVEASGPLFDGLTPIAKRLVASLGLGREERVLGQVTRESMARDGRALADLREGGFAAALDRQWGGRLEVRISGPLAASAAAQLIGQGAATHRGQALSDLEFSALEFALATSFEGSDLSLFRCGSPGSFEAFRGRTKVTSVSFEVLSAGGKKLGSLGISLPSRDEASWATRGSERWWDRLQSLVEWRVDLPSAWLARRALRGIGAGDVLFPARRIFAADGILGARLRLGHYARSVRLEIGERVRMQLDDDGEVVRGETRSEGPDSGGLSEALAAAPVELRAELGRVRMSGSELASLERGDVIDTGLDLGATITLAIGDRAIGVAELVSVGGNIGLKVLEWNE